MIKPLPRIRDVALAAGVSTATVSRALSHPERVSKETRERVLAAVEKTGYTINYAARNLRRRRTGSIVVLVPNLANPFFSAILSAIASEIAPAGYNVLIADTAQPPHSEQRILEYLNNNRADGLILLDGALKGVIERGRELSVGLPPLIFACEWISEDGFPSVRIDNAEGARLAIRHLVDLGHTRIGHVAGPPENVLTVERRRGAREAIAKAGLEIREDWFFPGDFTMGSGAEAARAWFSLKDRPTAIFCSSDEMAFGFISELHRNGLEVPDAVSVVGFDDIEISKRFVPSLTTIHQPRARIGRKAARLLLDVIDGDDEDRRRARTAAPEILPIELVVRESTSKARA
ncbi:LacI family DNA-binding transcriptional regulator [Rhizobiales bacterium]|uniref:LacI family DNA-binding transcriptional regulator n=1 Tax=Hongsoonwoonella zoysiae TaxID=2821844 RepID=UPI0015615C30|nr:LacI family DNA-binding transcriptional regulator [Hongsoonwoonella zoysiae]NRG17533.1 LacI family DNA-binding transcriptional regulator [Hongsoonwoonella zoysiae]